MVDAEDLESTTEEPYQRLAAYRHCLDRMHAAWPAFAARRRERLKQGLFGAPVEKIAENILEELFTSVLDWPLADVDLQIARADMVLSSLGIKRVIVEVKRPGSLVWQRPAIVAALDQARRYAAEQGVDTVAVSDGHMLYAGDVVGGGLRDRVQVDLDGARLPEDLWWLSVHGVYRLCPASVLRRAALPELPVDHRVAANTTDGAELLHPKYHLAMASFAYVGSPHDPHTWKLPYLLADGAPDTKRLPKAIQSILSNYRGARVGVPREAIGDVLVRLGAAATSLRKMPCQCEHAADAYVEAHHALDQLGRLAEVGCCPDN